MKIVVLDGYTLNPGDIRWEPIRKLGELTVYDRTPSEQIERRCADVPVVFTNKTPLRAETLRSLPQLKYIGLLSTGYDVVDVQEAKKLGITVTNIPSYSTEAVAQMTFAFLLELTNHVALHSQSVHNGEWSACADFCFWKTGLYELASKTIGLLGYGRIGRQTAKIAEAFGMRVIAHTRTPFQDPIAEWVSLDELLKQSDVLSLHAPLNDQTRGIINRNNILKMKDGAILINTSRGALVCETDLAEALRSGKLSGAGLDVLSSEPPKPDHPLLGCPNCLITPHIAWAGLETRQRLMKIAAENLSAFLSGQPIHCVE